MMSVSKLNLIFAAYCLEQEQTNRDILHTCRRLFDSVKSGKLHKESRIISLSRFVSPGGCGPLLLILTHGLPEPHRKDRIKEASCLPVFMNN